ncbi:cornifelin homolog isoform X3 [Hemicordylus capensis]|uniref:cornifelin homolog isoform X3 n=1 Tax=Hemicordylus capensis TaxID=884348 RepID=UPI0023033370|nr:cornifelin homolog isoform X3 [Hemicordylus capensis]
MCPVPLANFQVKEIILLHLQCTAIQADQGYIPVSRSEHLCCTTIFNIYWEHLLKLSIYAPWQEPKNMQRNVLNAFSSSKELSSAGSLIKAESERQNFTQIGASMSYQTEVIIDSQPQATGTSYTLNSQEDWNSDLCDCCSDIKLCLCATFIPCILACHVAEEAGESCCLPCLPGSLIALRTDVRARYHIQGSICEDWVVMTCCPLCGLCQLSRQLNKR